MKKTFALLLAVLMVAMIALPMSAKSNETVNALYFEEAPVFDGVITEDEWGEPTVLVQAGQATTYQMGTDAVILTMKLWIRWDEEFMYVGIVSPDTDGQSLQAGESSNWNGDSIQFRFDAWGPNSSGDPLSPFSTNNSEMPNVSFGYLTNEKKLNAFDHRSLLTDLNNTSKFAFAENGGDFTWEIAIRHTDICINNADALAKVGAGFTYGCTVVRLNAPTGGTYNAWLTWGDGVCGPQDDALRGGSNAVVLSADPAVVVEEEEDGEEAAAEAGEAAAEAPKAAKTADAAVLLSIVGILGSGIVITKKRG